MEVQTKLKPADPKNASFSFQVIDWRDKNGHLLARIIVGKDKMVISVKCHRCKHVEEKDINNKNLTF